MNWYEIDRLWRSQTHPAATAGKFDAAACERRRRRLARMLWWRDWSEAAVAVLVAAAFVLLAAVLRLPPAPVALSVALLVVLAAFFVMERVRARRARLGAEAPVGVRLESEIAELKRQRVLLRNVVWWYLLPSGGAVAMFLVAILLGSPDATRRALLVPLAGFVPLFVAVCAVVWWLNRRVVRTELEPRLRELEEARSGLVG